MTMFVPTLPRYHERMFNRVLILSASAGNGHVRAAQAVEKAFAQLDAAHEVRHVDALTYTNRLFRKLYANAYLELVNKAPDLLGWLYDRLDQPGGDRRLEHVFNKLNTRPLVKMLEEYQPDLFVCTHFLPSDIIWRLRAKGRVRGPLAITVTDLDVHALWLTPQCDHYFVAIDETREHLVRLGVPADRVTVAGIPIDPVFATAKDKAAMRRQFGLQPEVLTILLSAGGFGVGPIDNLLTSLAQLQRPAQVVAICGKNAELKARLDKRFGSPRGASGATAWPSNVQFHITGFTTQMDEYMAAADLIVGKPGGLTTSESLARGLAMVIINPIPGQEERNSDHLLEEGVAIRCNNLPALAYKIDRLIDDPRKLEAMRQAALRLGRPDSALRVVRRLLEMRRQAASVSN